MNGSPNRTITRMFATSASAEINAYYDAKQRLADFERSKKGQ